MHVWCVRYATDGHGLVCAAGICVCSRFGWGVFSKKSLFSFGFLERYILITQTINNILTRLLRYVEVALGFI